ncbi:MAG TPA: HAMP domain-containing sensor histidine kinase [Terriglobales bacterium]
MRVASRAKTIAFFITLSACLIGVAIALNVTWIVINWRAVGALIIGIILFAFIIAGIVLNTIFLVREIRRNEQQDSFLNAVTHELKTPIASIRLYLETLQRREVADAERLGFYRIMLDDTDRLLGTVEQVLKAGEERHADAESHREQVNFSAIVRDSVELASVRHHLAPGALRFGTEPPDEIIVVGNQEELRTAVANLLNNAVKYSGTEKDIEVNLLMPDIDTVLMRVQDQGVGITRSELGRIFRRFYRVETQANSTVRGTGLGLFIVRSIVRRHGGEVTAESAGEGRGSTFTIRLPRSYRV